MYITLMEEGEVFFYNRKQRDDWRLQVMLVEKVAIFGHIS